MTTSDSRTAFHFDVDIYPESFDSYEALEREIADQAYEFVLRMEEHIMANELVDVEYDDESLRLAYEDDAVDHVAMEVNVVIDSSEYANQIDLLAHE